MKIARTMIPLAALMTALAAPATQASDFIAWPDGRKVKVVQPNRQVDLSALYTGVRGKTLDRRFETNEALYLANEIYLSGTEFFLRASAAGVPMAHDRAFSYITNVEAYWYSRYNLMSLTTQSRCGIGVVHGPYLELRARKSTALNQFGRFRGELPLSNKDVMLTQVVASYLERTGMPEKFENAVPTMLEFASCDPKLVLPVDLSPDSHERPSYLDNFWGQRWDFDGMEKVIDMGGVAQSMLKKVLWAKFFLRRNHTDDDFPGEVFLGNNAEDGLRGAMLTLESVSTMLMAKSALFADADGKKLGGIDPRSYDPAKGLRYLPHRIDPELIYMTDMPVRHFDFDVGDGTSTLWDQASWLWALSEFYDYSNPRKRDNWDRVFGYQTPFDGSIMEQKYNLLARLLAGDIFDNIRAQHVRNGHLVSRWSPESGPEREVAIQDLALAVTALARYAEVMDLDSGRRQAARDLVRREAMRLSQLADEGGLYGERYDLAAGTPTGEATATAQAFAIQALMAAWRATGEDRFLAAARRTAGAWVATYWDAAAGLFRNRPGDDHVVYRPHDVAAILTALRELILVDRDPEMLQRFKLFFVQSVDRSGLMQSEDIFTGEQIEAVRAGNMDSDSDEIPFLGSRAAHGAALVFASKVGFDLGEKAPSLAAATTAPPSPRPVTGAAIFAANCAICHGDGGVGNEGPRLVDNPYVQLTGHAGVAQTVANGRLGVGMPAWGGVLTKDEIDKVVDYIRGLGDGGSAAGSGS